MDLWNQAKNLVTTAANTGVVQDLSATAQQAAQDRLASEINKLYATDMEIVKEAQPKPALVDPELSKVKAPSSEPAPRRNELPKWAIPAVIAVAAVVAVVAFIGKFGKKKKKGGK